MMHLAPHWKHAASARGSALIAVVFTLLVVGTITSCLTIATRTDLTLSRTLELEVENELWAEGGIALAILNLSNPNNKAPFIPDGRSYEVRVDGKSLAVRVQSESGKINLNQSPNPLLERLLRSCGGESEAGLLGNAIESRDVSGDGSPRIFLTVDELKRLPGTSAELVGSIEPYVSVYNFRAEPEIELAPEKLKELMVVEGHNSRSLSEKSNSSSGVISSRSGIFTITASIVDDTPGPSIQAIVYLTGNKGEPYYLLDWRRAIRRESTGCGEAQVQ